MKKYSFSRLALCVLCGASLCVLLLAPLAHAQQRWVRTYGGTSDDEGIFVQQTSDGGYIVAGDTRSFGAGNWDFYLIKTDASGAPLWTKTYGGVNDDRGGPVQQTSDGGYIVSGYTSSFGAGGSDVWLIKTNASGDTLWTRTYGGTNDDGGGAQQTSDGGYFVAGQTKSFGDTLGDVYFIKTNASGDTLWTRTYGGGTNGEMGWGAQQTSDGGYIISATTNAWRPVNSDVYLIKTNASGDTLWTRTYGGTGDDWGTGVQQTSDGGYIVTGLTTSFGAGGYDVWLIKTNASGDTLWTRTYGGTRRDEGYSVQQTSDGGYIVSGLTTSFGAGWDDVYLIKTNASGAPLWTRTYGGVNDDEGLSVHQALDGGYIIGGWTMSFGAGNQDVWLIKTDANGNIGVEENKGFEGSRVQGFKITPNPFTSFATVPAHSSERFTLYDVSGRKVGTCRGDRIGEGLSPGVYFLVPVGGKAKPLRIVKVR